VKHRRSRTALVTVGGIAVLVFIGGCASGGAGGGDNGTEDFPDVTTSRKAGKPILSTADSASVGSVVIDSKGYTLYRFDKDSPSPSKSNCIGSCVKKWPPALAGDQLSTKGISQSLVGKVKRQDGRWQLTLGGWPLYRFAGDRRAGDVKGQNVAGVWFAVGPDGKKAKTTDTSGYDPNSGEDGSTPTRFGPLTAADRDLLAKVRQAGLWQTSVGQQAKRRAQSQQVKEVGGRLAQQLPELEGQVRSTAGRLRVVLPTKPEADQQAWVKELAAKSGKEYDKLFVNRLRAADGKVFSAAAQVRAGTRNSLVRAFAQRVVDVFMAQMTLLERTGLVDDLALIQQQSSSQSYSRP
jgi:predicted lipoprotein with Yx(FWY)xxD motif/predicted outer membrane protein